MCFFLSFILYRVSVKIVQYFCSVVYIPHCGLKIECLQGLTSQISCPVEQQNRELEKH